MRLARVLSVSALACLTALSSLHLLACQGKKAEVSSTEPTASQAAPLASASNAISPKIIKAPEASPEEPFKAKIEANLPKVKDPQIEQAPTPSTLDNATFRDHVIGFAREVASGSEKISCDITLASKRPFKAYVWAFKQGDVLGMGEATNESLCIALKDATRRLAAAAGGEKNALADTRLLVELPDHFYSLVEHEKKGVELTHGLVPVRSFDKALLKKRIEEGKDYLFRVIDPDKKGVHKFYHAPVDKFEPKLHTIYSASTGLTLLKLRKYAGDETLLKKVEELADFMLSMQSHDEKSHTTGAFFYTFNTAKNEHDHKLVVGTTSKAIFTLLELYAAKQDQKYLDAAKLAADWLVTMQRPDGSVRSYLKEHEGGQPTVARKDSILYTGQVLSALSRVARVTKEPKYLSAAAQTAHFIRAKVAGTKGCYVGDEYRKPNPISTSWAIMSLLDFVLTTQDKEFEQDVYRCADSLLARQWRRPEDPYRYGRWRGSLSSSGSGWLAEVYSEVYMHCKSKPSGNCEKYKEAILFAIRQALQYTYTPENDFITKNPKMADGGIFWSTRERYVRTDAVCHGMNSYINMMPFLEEGELFRLPERPLAEQMALDVASKTEAGRDEPNDEEDNDEEDDDKESRGPETQQSTPHLFSEEPKNSHLTPIGPPGGPTLPPEGLPPGVQGPPTRPPRQKLPPGAPPLPRLGTK